MSSSSAEVGLSIVVGSNGARASVESCLAALERQVDGAEVLVCEPEASPPEVRERFPFARFLLLESGYLTRSLLGRQFVRLHELLASPCLFSGIRPAVDVGRFLGHARGAIRGSGRRAPKSLLGRARISSRPCRGSFGKGRLFYRIGPRSLPHSRYRRLLAGAWCIVVSRLGLRQSLGFLGVHHVLLHERQAAIRKAGFRLWR